ncbi:hypothetical protein [Geoalkalibacter halelectricus]|uniref:Solute:sodium symporter small subunit n=1 Tax=Geoalkalibacter halelectricus TaxID=2847045 RepID=A0ABY5ZLI4_9BACT|nr:hypothetical protein [Geoalkalibacter halelectricus]MDO3378314.1 hypothetical protein [Geoalkalibacter halelectricus]UWZ79319.1 hypothetical protein L9S41_16800 [Geoalkalibacter halelectricus]
MNLVQMLEALNQRWKLLVRLFLLVLALLVVIDAIPALVDKEKAHTAMELLPGFWSVYGFISCVLIVYVSKWFGDIGIMRREDFYDD